MQEQDFALAHVLVRVLSIGGSLDLNATGMNKILSTAKRLLIMEIALMQE